VAVMSLGACSVPARTGTADRSTTSMIGGAANPWQGTQSWDQWYRDHPSYIRND
jgi:hypothetical protein